ncbi:MAG: hypothetical protein EA426_19590 [Spirochaetaceae bacterium]|nr:MAG: hypothetical protein EA426_19590 [Spirochaetaceae bacterium]
MAEFRADHDLTLPAWGPYSKKYIGTSHLADPDRGVRFDFSVIPGLYRRSVAVPSVRWECGHHPWAASADLTFSEHRHELVWKDDLYVDVSFALDDDSSTVFSCNCVNRTHVDQNLTLNLVSSLAFPTTGPNSQEILAPARAVPPDGAIWVDALSYTDLTYARGRPTDTLVPDALLRGEIRASRFVGGSALGDFGEAGDRVEYEIAVNRTIEDCATMIRYRTNGRSTAKLELCLGGEHEIELPSREEIGVIIVPIGRLAAASHRLSIRSRADARVEIDGFLIADAATIATIAQSDLAAVFPTTNWNPRPELSTGPAENSVILRYPGIDTTYGLVWWFTPFHVREFLCSDLDIFMRHRVHDHVRSVLVGPGDGHFTDVFLRPIHVPPGSSRRVVGLVVSGDEQEVTARLAGATEDLDRLTAVHETRRATAVTFAPTVAGREFRFSQELMAATMLMNVVYPVYARGRFVRHNTPGRWWDSLYTWDSGFIAIGLLPLDSQRAADCISAYLTDPDDKHAVFVHHGSPVPVQIIAMQEYWNATRDLRMLEHWYPRLRRYHDFLCGRVGSSTTRTLSSGLIRTWDYFYNSGGWDDYPPQVHVHRNGLEPSVTPVANSAMAIRTAKILASAARLLGRPEDVETFGDDVHELTDALQMYAWDENSGYFGYVVHDAAGHPEGILRNSSGENLNMGLDGIYPLVAGVATEAQEATFIRYLSDPDRLWSEIGISTVDRSASYFRHDGYWNGAVWMPHQWLIWKTLLDHGHTDLAFRIADTALTTWRRETDETYNCYEHFMVESRRGAGWHQFGGLSSPVLHWFSAYYRPGRISTGFDTWVESLEFHPDNRAATATVRSTAKRPVIIACLNPGVPYRVTVDGERIETDERLPGVLEIPLGSTARPSGRAVAVEITARGR